VESLEQAARDIGRRWGAELKAAQSASGRAIGNWPGTLDEARRLVDAAAGRRLDDQERELLAMLVERGARREWHSRDDVTVPSPNRSGVLRKPSESGEHDDNVDLPRRAG
jgi:hypothetical protein